MTSRQTDRRSFFTKAAAFLASFGVGAATASSASGASGLSTASGATAGTAAAATANTVAGSVAAPHSAKRRSGVVVKDDDVPLFSSSVVHDGLVYIAGKGAHFEGDITAHTDHVLNELQKELEEAGSSMENVLKVNVYLHDLHDYAAMNKAYRGRFGENPPVRTTVACFGGVPGDSLVEIDCIAALNS